MDKDSLLYDMEVRFAEEDRGTYGDGWHTFSELAIVCMRAHDLIALEAIFAIPMPKILDAFREDATYANMACAWLAAGRPGEFKDFNPLILQAEWRRKETEEEPGKSPELPESEPGESATAPEDSGVSPSTPVQASIF